MLTFLATTGAGTCLLIIIGMVGVPLAMRNDAKEKPGVTAPGQNINQ